jgi:hypothetical protein
MPCEDTGLTAGLKPCLTIALALFLVAGAFDHRDRAAGVTAVEADDHGKSQVVDLPACTGKSWRQIRFGN